MSPAVALPTVIEVAAACETHTRSDSPAIFSLPPVVSPLLIRCVCLGKRLEYLMLEWNGGFRLGVNGDCRDGLVRGTIGFLLMMKSVCDCGNNWRREGLVPSAAGCFPGDSAAGRRRGSPTPERPLQVIWKVVETRYMAPFLKQPRHKTGYMASGDNRGQKGYILASLQYASVPDPRQNMKNNRGRKPLLHW